MRRHVVTNRELLETTNVVAKTVVANYPDYNNDFCTIIKTLSQREYAQNMYSIKYQIFNNNNKNFLGVFLTLRFKSNLVCIYIHIKKCNYIYIYISKVP